MLNKVVSARPVLARMRHDPAHRVKLVVAREDHCLFSNLLDAFIRQNALFLHLQMHEASEDVEQAVPRATGKPCGIRHRRRVDPGVPLVAEVAGQEMCLVSAQPRGHKDLILIHRKSTNARLVNSKSGSRWSRSFLYCFLASSTV